MKRLIIILFMVILLILPSLTFAYDALNNTTDLTKAFNDAESGNKSLMLVFDQDDCVYCDLLKKNVLSDDKVISELNANYITVIIDINEHPEIADEYKIYGTPTVVFLDSSHNQIGKIEGYVDADEFLSNLKGL